MNNWFGEIFTRLSVQEEAKTRFLEFSTTLQLVEFEKVKKNRQDRNKKYFSKSYWWMKSRKVLLNVMWKRREEREKKSRYHKLVKFCVEEKLFVRQARTWGSV